MTPAQAAPDKAAAVSKIETRALSVCEQAKAIKIASQHDAIEAADLLNSVINVIIREGDELFDPMIAAAYQTHQLAIATKRKAVGGLPAAKAYLRTEIARWEQHLEDQERRAAILRQQLAQAEEAARIERELEAVEAEAGPDAAEEVLAILEAPRAFTMPARAPAPKLAGVSTRDVYTCEVTDVRKFFKGIADGVVPFTLADPNQGALNRMAGAMKEGFNLPGCKLIKSKQANSARR